MMGKAAVLDMTRKKVSEDKPKATKQPLQCLEERPRPEWFVKVKTSRGQVLWFLRFAITGREVRRYGPFVTKRQCLRFLNEAIGEMYDAFSEIERVQEEYQIPRRAFEGELYCYPISEQAITLHAKHLHQKGR